MKIRFRKKHIQLNKCIQQREDPFKDTYRKLKGKGPWQ